MKDERTINIGDAGAMRKTRDDSIRNTYKSFLLSKKIKAHYLFLCGYSNGEQTTLLKL